MSRLLPAATVTSAVVAAIVGASSGATVGILTAIVVGAAAAALLRWFEGRRVARLTAQVDAWGRGDSGVVMTGGARWRELGAALNRVAAVYDEQRRQLAEERPWRHDLVDALASPAVLFDADGQAAAANAHARDLLGVTSIGTGIIETLGSARLADAVERARREGAHVAVDAELGDRQVTASIAVVGRETLVILTDRTRERRIEEVRRNFVVNASHELKTPAMAIQTLSEALEILAAREPARIPELVARLNEEADRLVHLVHDLLDLRRLEEATLVSATTVDLVPLIGRVVADLDQTARDRQIRIDVDAVETAFVRGDHDDLVLVLRNLVANAVQYNRDGGIVTIELSREAGDWRVDVADTGIGIPQHDLPRIFERFYRVDVARSRKTGGTGLGLSIVRHAVERHGGRIHVESLLGEGSRFTVRLPAAADQAPST